MFSPSRFYVVLFLQLLIGSVSTFSFKPTPSCIPKSKVRNDEHPSTVKNDADVSLGLERRAIFQKAFVFATAMTTISTSTSANAAVLQSGNCVSGQGEACGDLSGGNELIKSLQKKSAENREANAKESLNAYYMKNYPDYFASLNPPQYLVKKTDGSFIALTDEEITDLKKEGKIRMEVQKTKGGKVTDLTQKPIMMLVE